MSSPDLERQGAQALLATYLQMTRYAQLARALQHSREQSIERRLSTAVANDEIERLQQSLEAQQNQGAVLDGAVERFEARQKHLVQFAESGVTYEDFEEMGAGAFVSKDEVEEAVRRRAATRSAPTEAPAPESTAVEPSVEISEEHAGDQRE